MQKVGAFATRNAVADDVPSPLRRRAGHDSRMCRWLTHHHTFFGRIQSQTSVYSFLSYEI